MDKFNVDEAIDEMNTLLGNPQKLLRDDADVQKIRQDRAHQQQQANASQMASQDANTVKSGAQAAEVMSNVEVGQGKNALEQLMGG